MLSQILWGGGEGDYSTTACCKSDRSHDAGHKIDHMMLLTSTVVPV